MTNPLHSGSVGSLADEGYVLLTGSRWLMEPVPPCAAEIKVDTVSSASVGFLPAGRDGASRRPCAQNNQVY